MLSFEDLENFSNFDGMPVDLHADLKTSDSFLDQTSVNKEDQKVCLGNSQLCDKNLKKDNKNFLAREACKMK